MTYSRQASAGIHLITSQELSSHQAEYLNNKQIGYLGLAISQIIEKIFIQKLKFDEFQNLKKIILDAHQRSKKINLSEGALLVLNYFDRDSYHGPSIELEKKDSTETLTSFLKYLISIDIEKKLTAEQKNVLRERLEQSKNHNYHIQEISTLLEKL